MSGPELLKLLVTIQQIIDRLIQYQIERSRARDKEALARALAEARRARTPEEKSDAAEKIARAFAGQHGDPPLPGGRL